MHDRVTEMLEILTTRRKRSEVLKKMDLNKWVKCMDPIFEAGWVSMGFQGTTNPNQTDQITEAGQRILELINH